VKPFFDDVLLNAIGGCCGTGPEHIAAMRSLVLENGYKPRKKHSTLLMLYSHTAQVCTDPPLKKCSSRTGLHRRMAVNACAFMVRSIHAGPVGTN
jgi:hypothetical protein